MSNPFGKAKKVGYFPNTVMTQRVGASRTCYDDTVWTDFEMTKLPIPKGYDEILRGIYGDYMTIVKGGSAHEEAVFDPDISYLEYYRKNGVL